LRELRGQDVGVQCSCGCAIQTYSDHDFWTNFGSRRTFTCRYLRHTLWAVVITLFAKATLAEGVKQGGRPAGLWKMLRRGVMLRTGSARRRS